MFLVTMTYGIIEDEINKLKEISKEKEDELEKLFNKFLYNCNKI